MISAGFEPAPPKRVGLKSTALDHSARRSCFATFVRSQDQIKVWLLYYCCTNVIGFHFYVWTNDKYPLRDLNPRPSD